MKQYEIRWAELPQPIGRRPVLLLSRDAAYEYLTKAIVAEITTRIRRIPQEVHLGPREGLPRPCVANLDNLHTVEVRELAERLGALARRRIPEVKRALGFTLGWPELTLSD
ncbi:MAG: toxin MazF5 [Myxococcaceae bacterium]